ncbi:hypothetical protein CEXT_5791, partial [Caerostris extrusa]
MNLQHAMREVSKLELYPLSSCKKHKIINFNSQIERNAARLNNHEHDNDGFYYALKKLIAKVNCAKNYQHLVETKNSFGKLIVDEQEEQDSDTTPIVKKMPPIMVKPTENLKTMFAKFAKFFEKNTFDFLSDISEPFDFRKNCLKFCEQKQSVSQIDGDPCPVWNLNPCLGIESIDRINIKRRLSDQGLSQQ